MIGYPREAIGRQYPWQIHDEWVDWLNYNERARGNTGNGKDNDDDDDEDEEVRI